MNGLYIVYGDNGQDMARQVLRPLKVEQELAGLGKKHPRIAIKPNLVVAQPAHWGATTSPDLVRGVIGYLKECGFDNICIMESAWVGDSTREAFKICGYEDISREFDVPLVDLKGDEPREVTAAGMKLSVCGQALEVDYLINMPVLKAHCQTKLTCALKNLKGCIPDREKRRFHTLGLHRPIACLNKALPVNLVVVDGLIGDLTHEEGGNPVKMDRVIAARDPVMVDAYCARLLGYEVADIDYIGLAAELGVGTAQVSSAMVVELNDSAQSPGNGEILAGTQVDQLRQWIVADQACSACFAACIYALQRLQEQGKLGRLKTKVHVGQGHKQLSGAGVGIGACTRGLNEHLGGCPPGAVEVVRYLERFLSMEK